MIFNFKKSTITYLISACLFTNFQFSLASEFNRIDNINIGVANWNKNFKECFNKSLSYLNDGEKIEKISVNNEQAIKELVESYNNVFNNNYYCNYNEILDWISAENITTYRYVINDRTTKSKKAVSYAVLKKSKLILLLIIT